MINNIVAIISVVICLINLVMDEGDMATFFLVGAFFNFWAASEYDK